MKALLLTIAVAMGPAPLSRPAPAAEYRLGLDEAIARALQKDESLLSGRESAAAASAAFRGAEGAYDQVLELEGSWDRSKDPTQSALPGVTSSSIVPDDRSSGVRLGIRRLLPTGGALSLRAGGARGTSAGVAAPSPADRTQGGV